ncbi:MAG: flagellar hook-basal body complex protein [Verrucomicrobia bacterium]|nr:flagellar hook-basal body complex protein [Verrucomicrobiota bacterium]
MSLRALNTGVTGIKQFQSALDNIGNNLANINTVGYKSSRVEFADTLNQTLRAGTPDSGASGSGTAPAQVGNGVTVSGVKNLFTQGAVTQTGVSTDLAISGEGFFIVQNKATGENFATRAGDFRTDASGFLVNNAGYRVQGFTTVLAPGLADFPDADVPGDIKLDRDAYTNPDGSANNSPIANLTIDGNGKINVSLQDGSQFVRGQILLQNYANPGGLLKGGNNLFSNLAAAGPLTGPGKTNTNSVGSRPNTGGVGRIDAGALELSNVDISREFANMITTQRAFQANARVVTTSDQILQEIVQLVR